MITNRKIFIRLFILLFCFLSFAKVQALDEFEERLKEAKRQLTLITTQNAENDRKGLSHLNQYIFSDDPEFLKIIGDYNNDYKYLLEAFNGNNFKDLTQELLREYNTWNDAQLEESKKGRLYVYLAGIRVPENVSNVGQGERVLSTDGAPTPDDVLNDIKDLLDKDSDVNMVDWVGRLFVSMRDQVKNNNPGIKTLVYARGDFIKDAQQYKKYRLSPIALSYNCLTNNSLSLDVDILTKELKGIYACTPTEAELNDAFKCIVLSAGQKIGVTTLFLADIAAEYGTRGVWRTAKQGYNLGQDIAKIVEDFNKLPDIERATLESGTQEFIQGVIPNIVSTITGIPNPQEMADKIANLISQQQQLEDNVQSCLKTFVGHYLSRKESNRIVAMNQDLSPLSVSTISNEQRNLTASEMSPTINGLSFGNNDGYIDIIIHGYNNKYYLRTEGENETKEITTGGLAGMIRAKNLPSGEIIRLLSCSNLESAKNLALALDRPIIASDGVVTLYFDANNVLVSIHTVGEWKKIILVDDVNALRETERFAEEEVGFNAPASWYTGPTEKWVRMGPKILSSELEREIQLMLGTKFDDFMSMINRLNSLTIKKKDVGIVFEDKYGKQWAVLTKDRFEAVAGIGTGTGDWNALLDINPPLMKNFEYLVDGKFTFTTDDEGRVNKIIADDMKLNARKRNLASQKNAKNLKDGARMDSDGYNDDGGHMIRSQFYGPSEQINYFPQNAATNRPPGAWFNMERDIENLISSNPNSKIKVEITPIFGNPDRKKRPTEFEVEVFVNDQPYKTFPTIYNPE